MKRSLSIAIGLALILNACAHAGDSLKENFTNPTEAARAWCYWWWLNGYVTQDAIVRDLDEMKRQGISGALVFHAGRGVTPRTIEFMSREWLDMFRFAVNEAAERNITITFNACGGWNAGGPWVKPKHAARQLVYATVETTGPSQFDANLPQPAHPKQATNEARDYRDAALLAWQLDDTEARAGRICLSKSCVDLSAKRDDSRLAWDVPAGKWLIVRFGSVIGPRAVTKFTGGTGGYEIDPLNAEAMERHFDATVGTVIREVREHVGETFTHAHIDSGEIGSPNWTAKFPEHFQRLRGYDPRPYLAARVGLDADTHNPLSRTAPGGTKKDVVWVDDPEITKRFLEDYDRTIADLYIECYYGRLDRLSREHGLAGAHSEAAGYQKPAVDALRAMGSNDICMSEFWSRKELLQRRPGDSLIHQLTQQAHIHDGIKTASSAAHIYGRKIIQAEAFTVMRSKGRFNGDQDPFELKDIGDRAFCQGLNRNVLCFFVCQPEQESKPGYYWPLVGADFNRHLTWWPMSHGWLKYLNRCQHLFQEGRFVADICYFQGEWTPVYVPAKWAMNPPLPPGLDCDVMNVEALMKRSTVDPNGSLTLPNGLQYPYLVLCQGGRWGEHAVEPLALSPSTLAKLKELVEAGMTLIGPRPVRAIGLTDYPRSDTQVRALADVLWGNSVSHSGERRVGNGRVIWGRPLADVIRADQFLVDLEIRETAHAKLLAEETLSGIRHPGTFDWIHYRIDNADVYFITNLRNAVAAGQFTFRDVANIRGQARQPELWDAVTGRMRDLPAYRIRDDRRIATMLRFAPRQSFFVVFRKPMAEPESGRVSLDHAGMLTKNFPEPTLLKQLTGPWNVRFDPRWGAPASLVFDELVDWTERPEAGIKYYSGTATYAKNFDLPGYDDGRAVILDLGEIRNVAQVRLNGEDLGVVWTAPWQVDITDAVKPTGNQLEIDVANLWSNRLIGDRHLPETQRFTKTSIPLSEDANLLPSGLLGPVTIQVTASHRSAAGNPAKP
jgi:(4-O-methyl)-D-glucuronate---lignin esterase